MLCYISDERYKKLPQLYQREPLRYFSEHPTLLPTSTEIKNIKGIPHIHNLCHMLQFHKRIVSDKANDGYSRGKSIQFFWSRLSEFKPQCGALICQIYVNICFVLIERRNDILAVVLINSAIVRGK